MAREILIILRDEMLGKGETSFICFIYFKIYTNWKPNELRVLIDFRHNFQINLTSSNQHLICCGGWSTKFKKKQKTKNNLSIK